MKIEGLGTFFIVDRPRLFLYICFAEKKQDPEQNTGKCKGTAQAGVKHSDKHIRDQTGRTQGNASAHHDRHNAVGAQVEKMPDRLPFFFITVDPLPVPDAHFGEHETESAEHQQGEQDMNGGNSSQPSIGNQAEPCHIKSCQKPYTPGDGK